MKPVDLDAMKQKLSWCQHWTALYEGLVIDIEIPERGENLYCWSVSPAGGDTSTVYAGGDSYSYKEARDAAIQALATQLAARPG